MQCKCGGHTKDRDGAVRYRECQWCGRIEHLDPRPEPVTSSRPVHRKRRAPIRGGLRKWRTLDDRSGFDYARLPDDMLRRMKAEATSMITTFNTGNTAYAEQITRTGLYGINLELWRRGLTPAQEGKQ